MSVLTRRNFTGSGGLEIPFYNTLARRTTCDGHYSPDFFYRSGSCCCVGEGTLLKPRFALFTGLFHSFRSLCGFLSSLANLLTCGISRFTDFLGQFVGFRLRTLSFDGW